MNEPGESGLRVFQFSTASYRLHERVAAWREVFGRTVAHIEIDPQSPDRFHASATVSHCQTFGLVKASTSPVRQANSKPLIVNDDVSFGVVVSSRWSASQFGRSVDLHPGDGVLLSNSDVGGITLPNKCHYLAFCIPRSALESLVPHIGALFSRRIPASSPALRLLLRYLEFAQREQVVSTRELATAFIGHVCDLLALTMGPTRDGAVLASKRGLSVARLEVMKEDIVARLGQPSLSVHTVAARHKVGIRYLQKLFEESGCTFTKFVAEQRLMAAYKAIIARPNVPISAIAYDLGFNDASYFNRTFRQRFGCTPSDIRARFLKMA